MTAAAGLAPGQVRAIGITLGALYTLYAVRGVATQLQARPDVVWGTVLVSALVWLPGVAALPAFIVDKVRVGRRLLRLTAFLYPVAILVWPLVAVRDEAARLDFWIHGMPGLAAVSAILTLPRGVAWLALILNNLLVEVVMREIGVVVDWRTTLVRSVFALVYSGFFFVLVLSMLRDINRGNRVLLRSGREQAEASMLQARDEEIVRLDRLTHDFVLSLLSAGAEGVPTDKLRVQAETVQRRLSAGRPDEDETGTVGEVVDRITRRCEGYGVPVIVGAVQREADLPRQAALEIEAAVEEAVRNTVRHASGGSRVLLEDDGVTIKVCDDGPGFDPTLVRERLGVSQSILHRMNSLPGGSATIDSAPGRGTTVTIGWTPS
ncbi:sensor histidine kinase [Granulicoccus sp. GXG6511]|uniref:sensor histidine kinase n=1 Tax=Granulicoccus sp. GXG6511 TaxID=3381351 RepID=UPI003D7D0118